MNNIILSSQENGIAELTENLEQDPGIIKTYLEGLVPSLLGFLLQVVLAIVILLIGSRLIKWLVKLIRKSLMRSRAETGVTTFLCSLLKYVMYFILIMVVLSQFGVTVENGNYAHFRVPGNQHYQGRDAAIEADWSQAGFWYAANFLSNEVDIRGLNPQSAQGDMVVSDLYWKLAKPGEAEIDVSGCPDLLPPLAVMAAVRQGTTRFVGAARLRIKESDRLATTAALLNTLGGQAEEGPDSLTVHGVSAFSGGTVDGANDHRIVMAAAIAATRSAAPVTILGAEAVKKSYPSFWEDYKMLGGVVHVL